MNDELIAIPLREAIVEVVIIRAIASGCVKQKQYVGLMVTGTHFVTTKHGTSTVGGAALTAGSAGEYIYVQIYGPWILGKPTDKILCPSSDGVII